MITKQSAQLNIQRWLDSLGNRYEGWIIVESMTIERTYGWLFFRATREYLRTKSIFSMPPGNSAILCLRDSGKFLFVGTAFRSEHYLTEYEKDPASFLKRFSYVQTHSLKVE